MHKDENKNVVEQGFTLVELLIVVVILGILAGIVVFAVGNLTSKAEKNACATEGETFRTAVVAYKADQGVWPEQANTALSFTAISSPTAALVAARLADTTVNLLSSATLKYNTGTAPNWTYNATNHTVVTAAC